MSEIFIDAARHPWIISVKDKPSKSKKFHKLLCRTVARNIPDVSYVIECSGISADMIVYWYPKTKTAGKRAEIKKTIKQVITDWSVK